MKVSVIIPVYNVEKYIERCLKSLTTQNLKDIEFIFVDDASTDNSVEIIKKYAESDSRIKLIRHKENKYTAEARNTGLNNATGEYIGFVDPDDEISNAFFEKLYNLAKENNADIAKGVLVTKPDNRIINNNDDIKKNKFNFKFNHTTAIYRHNLIKQHNIKFFIDVICFQLPVIYYSNKIVTCNDAVYYYWKNEGSCVNSEFTPEKWRALNIKGSKISQQFINSVNLSVEDYVFLSNELILFLIYYGWEKFSREVRLKEAVNLKKYLLDYVENNKYFYNTGLWSQKLQSVFDKYRKKYLYYIKDYEA